MDALWLFVVNQEIVSETKIKERQFYLGAEQICRSGMWAQFRS